MDLDPPAPSRRNHGLKDDIRAYWSKRAETFDRSTGHRIEDRIEAPAWKALFRDGLGDIAGARVLDIACGTGEISRMLLALGAEVTGIDFAEPMLARAKAKNVGPTYRAYLGDAEDLRLEEEGTYDALVTRHLVWTLTDPHAAFAEWRRVLKPGGKALIVDGDWVKLTLWGRLMKMLANRITKADGVHGAAGDLTEHNRILAGVHYAHGLTAARLEADLAAAGFSGFRRLDIRSVYGRGMAHARLADRLRLASASRFALVATRA